MPARAFQLENMVDITVLKVCPLRCVAEKRGSGSSANVYQKEGQLALVLSLVLHLSFIYCLPWGNLTRRSLCSELSDLGSSSRVPLLQGADFSTDGGVLIL